MYLILTKTCKPAWRYRGPLWLYGGHLILHQVRAYLAYYITRSWVLVH